MTVATHKKLEQELIACTSRTRSPLARGLAARQRAAVPGTSVDTQVRPGRRIPLTNLRKTGVVAGFAVSISGRIRSVRRGSGHVRRRRPTWQDVGGTSMQSSARRTASTT